MNDQWFYALDGQQHGPVQRERPSVVGARGHSAAQRLCLVPGMNRVGAGARRRGSF